MREIKYNWWTLKVMEKWETLNPNGRPKKWIAFVNSELADAWYTPATKQDIEANYMAMLQLEQDELLKLWNDKSNPMLIRIIAKNMLWWKWFDIVEKMLDRWIGKAVQKNDTVVSWDLNITNGSSILLDIQSGKIKKEDAYELLKDLKDKN